MWDCHTHKLLRTFEGHHNFVENCAWAPDGRVVVSCSLDHTLKTYDVSNGVNMHTFRGHQSRVSICLFSPDGRTICSSAEDGYLKLWESDTGVCINSLELCQAIEHSEQPENVLAEWESRAAWGIRFSDDGSLILCSTGIFSLKAWNVHSGLLQNTYDPLPTFSRTHSESGLSDVFCCSISPDGSCVVWA
jgi:WD40 repeat protein